MNRRDFLHTAAAATAATLAPTARGRAAAQPAGGPGFASPAAARNAPRETQLFVIALYDGTGTRKPGYLATVDVDPASPTYSQVVHRLPMPTLDDELHHFGWNICSSCHGDAGRERRFLI